MSLAALESKDPPTLPDTLIGAASPQEGNMIGELQTGLEIFEIVDMYDKEGREVISDSIKDGDNEQYEDSISGMQSKLQTYIDRFEWALIPHKKEALLALLDVPHQEWSDTYHMLPTTYKDILKRNIDNLSEPHRQTLSIDSQRNNIYIYIESGIPQAQEKRLHISGLAGDEKQFTQYHLYPNENQHLISLRPHHTVRGDYDEGTIKECCDYIKDFLDFKSWKNINIEGNSIGGQIVEEFTGMYPKYIKTLIPSAPSGLTQDADVVRDFLAIIFGKLEGPGAEAIFNIYSTKKRQTKQLSQNELTTLNKHREIIFDTIGENINRIGSDDGYNIFDTTSQNSGKKVWTRHIFNLLKQSHTWNKFHKKIHLSRTYFQQLSKRDIPDLTPDLFLSLKEQIVDKDGKFGLQEINKGQYSFLSRYIKFLFHDIDSDEIRHLVNEKAEILLQNKETFSWFLNMAKQTDEYSREENMHRLIDIARTCRENNITVIFTGGEDDPVVDTSTMHTFYSVFKSQGVDVGLLLMPQCKHSPTLEKNAASYVILMNTISDRLGDTLH